MKFVVPLSLKPSAAMAVAACGLFVASCADAQGPDANGSGADQWTLKRSRENWRVTGDLQAPANISAIASLDGTGFLIGSDDLTIAQYGAIDRDGKTLKVMENVTLIGSKDDDEVDIEGIAVDPVNKVYYVTGSHSLTKKGNMNKERRSVFRVGTSASGRPIRKVKDESLRKLIQRDTVLREFWKKPQQQGGVNIEGLAWKDGSLFFGFRSPNVDDCALVLEVGAQDLFQKGKVVHKLHRVPLGDGLGIREIAPIREGFLIVAGNAGDEPTREFPVPRDYRKRRGYELFFWSHDRGAVTQLARLPRSSGRPEALLVLDDSETATEMLILFDGIAGGAPLHFVISKG